MPSALKEMQEKASAFAELFHTPFLTIVWRVGWIAFFGIGAYAFNAYKHNMISADETVQQLLSDTAKDRALVTSHEVFIQEQANANAKLDAYFRDAREDRTSIATSLTKLDTHLTDLDGRLDRIERKQDYPTR